MTDRAPGTGWSERYAGGSEAAEAEQFSAAVETLVELQAAYAKEAESTRLRRPQHAKMHVGITDAEFEVRADVPDYLQIGMFQPRSRYPATLRFSNAVGRLLPDHERDLRGIAVRVTSAPDRSNDFLGANYPIGHATDVRQFIAFAKAVSAKSRFELVRRLLVELGPRQTFPMVRSVLAGTKRPVSSLAQETYWSRTPYQLGEAALRFWFEPSGPSNAASSPARERGSPDALKVELVDRLREGPVTFDFVAQLFVNETVTPIEDGASFWDPADAPGVAIGRLAIPQQDLGSTEAERASEAVEQMGFGPWNGAETFRPLGQLNRARRLAYRASQKARGATWDP